MSARSPSRDKRVITLAAEVAESRDRRIPLVLLKLKDILDSAPVGSSDGTRIRREVFDFSLLEALILVLKQDFSIVEGQWLTASRLSIILSQACGGLDLPPNDARELRDKLLPEAVHNMFLVARRIQARFVQVPRVPSKEQERIFLLGNFKNVLESVSLLSAVDISVTHRVLDSPWLLQLLITDCQDTVLLVMELIQKVIRANWVALKEMDDKTRFCIMDELIYKLSVEESSAIAAGATKCVLCICEYYKPMIESLSTRYRGLRPLLGRWEGRGFSRDLKSLLLLLEAGNAQRAEKEQYHQAALMVQANWRGYIARKKLAKANKAFAKLHKAFRNRRQVREETMTRRKMMSEAEHLGRLNRQRIMREFKERQLHCIEILPPAKVESYLRNEQVKAAVHIQKTWRGYRQRNQLSGHRDLVLKTRAAILIQRNVRRWLERLDKRRGNIPIQLLPPGLTDQRRVDLQKEIIAHRDRNPPLSLERADIEANHKKAADLLAKYYASIKTNRKAEQRRQALLARLDTDSELCQLAPALTEATQKDVEMYSSRSVPVATKARVNHMEQLRQLQLPWWKKLDDQFQDTQIEEEDFLLF